MMKEKIRWGIIGSGFIAHTFAEGLKVLPDAELIAACSTSKAKTDAFADMFGIQQRYEGAEQLASDPDIDVVYIATPNNYHKEHGIISMKAGKAVLCEKPMGVNGSEEEQMIQYSRKQGVFFMEAMWTRFLPVMKRVRNWLAEGMIGDVKMININFGFRTEWKPEGRLLNLDLIGGAIMDVGVYSIGLTSMVFGESPRDISSYTHLGETGVDEQTAVLLNHSQGRLAALTFAIRTNTPHEAQIFGTDGYILIPNFWRYTEATLYKSSGGKEHVEIPFESFGYNYEAAEVMKCLREGKTESDIMPLDESLEIMNTIDKIRGQIGLKFPMKL